MKRNLSLFLIGFIFLSCLFLPINATSTALLELSSEISSDITVSNLKPETNNVRITERELPFEINILETAPDQLYLAFPNIIQNTVMVKRTADETEIIPENGAYILESGNRYLYSVMINYIDRTEYYDAYFEVSADDPNYITYSDIIKNIVYNTSYDTSEYSIQGYTQITETEPNNNSVSGATVTYSDADNRGVINSSSDVDWWKIKFNYSGTANFWLGEIPDGCNYALTIYNTPGTTQLKTSNNSGNNPELITMNVIEGAYYTIKVSCSSGYNASSQYLLRVKNYPSFQENDVYKIKNYNYSTKYLSVANGYNANGQNVIISTEISEASTSFLNNYRMRINYYMSKDAYVISPICSYNGHGRALDVYNTGTISPQANVQTWKAQDVSNQIFADEQYFTFEECGSGIVIRMKYYTDYVLTANSSNVYIDTYNSTNTAQRWIFTEDEDYNDMEEQYKTYGWGWMYYSGYTPNKLNFSSSYGKRYYNSSDEKHLALDIPSPNGTTVYAATSGIVTQVGYKTGIEHFAVVKTNHTVYNDPTINLRVLYQHMSIKPSVDLEESVSQFTTEIGKTGQGHMHFCVITDGYNRLAADDYLEVNDNTAWHGQYFNNTTNPLLFYDWDYYGFTYN